MKKILLATVAALSALSAGAVMAEGALSYNIAVTSDYVWRGVSQTDENPALQGGIDYSNGIFYAGGWASNVDFRNSAQEDASVEIDVYAGVKPSVGNWTFDLGAIYYYYPDADDSNFGELKAGFSHPLGKGTIGAVVYTDWETLENPYYELNASYPLTDKFSVSGAMGKYEAAGGEYTTFNLGVGYALNKTISLDARYHATGDEALLGKVGESRYVATIKAAF
jgi:uncharacterized protein (TIGR02001 family)